MFLGPKRTKFIQLLCVHTVSAQTILDIVCANNKVVGCIGKFDCWFNTFYDFLDIFRMKLMQYKNLGH